MTDHWAGKEVCRWSVSAASGRCSADVDRCLNFRLAPPSIRCHRCEWAKYCSRECQWADWVESRGHQDECDMTPRQ